MLHLCMNSVISSVRKVESPSRTRTIVQIVKTRVSAVSCQSRYDSQITINKINRTEYKIAPLTSDYMGASKNRGTPKSSILIVVSIVNHPFWGTPIFGNIHIKVAHSRLFLKLFSSPNIGRKTISVCVRSNIDGVLTYINWNSVEQISVTYCYLVVSITYYCCSPIWICRPRGRDLPLLNLLDPSRGPYITNPNNAQLMGNPSNLPYIYIV